MPREGTAFGSGASRQLGRPREERGKPRGGTPLHHASGEVVLSVIALGPYLLVAATAWLVRRAARRARVTAAIAVLVALAGAVGGVPQRTAAPPGDPLFARFALDCASAVQVSRWILGHVVATVGPRRDRPGPTSVSCARRIRSKSSIHHCFRFD